MRLGAALSLWGPVLGTMAVLFGLSSRSTLPGSDWIWDKLAHVGAWSFLAWWTLRATHRGITAPRPSPTIVAVASALLYGIADEWHQAHVPGRHSSIADWCADVIGTGLAVVVFALAATLLRRRVGSDWNRAVSGARGGNG